MTYSAKLMGKFLQLFVVNALKIEIQDETGTCVNSESFNTSMCIQPVTVAERSKACTVFVRSEAGTVGSNPKQGMDV
jgi:hypothetical protein